MKRKMKDWIRKVFNLTFFVILSMNAVAHPSTDQISKVIEKSFAVTSSITIDINNKYGQVIINPWDKDSVFFTVKVTARDKKYDALDKQLDRVEIDVDKARGYLKVETIFDRKSSTFREFINSVGDYSKALLSKSQISVDYEISVPRSAVLFVNNKFGDVFIGNHTGKFNLDLSQGDFRANKIEGAANITAGFGNVRIKEMRDAILDLKAAEVEIQKGSNLSIESSSSTINISNCSTIKIDSKNDKTVRLRNIENVNGQGNFTNIEITQLKNYLDMDMNYGGLNIEQIYSDFRKIRLTARSSDLQLHIPYDSYTEVDITGRSEEIHLPMGAREKMNEIFVDDKEKRVNYSGFLGQEKKHISELYIKSNSGEVRIRRSQAPDFGKN
jgi:hypothetical protein